MAEARPGAGWLTPTTNRTRTHQSSSRTPSAEVPNEVPNRAKVGRPHSTANRLTKRHPTSADPDRPGRGPGGRRFESGRSPSKVACFTSGDTARAMSQENVESLRAFLEPWGREPCTPEAWERGRVIDMTFLYVDVVYEDENLAGPHRRGVSRSRRDSPGRATLDRTQPVAAESSSEADRRPW